MCSKRLTFFLARECLKHGSVLCHPFRCPWIYLFIYFYLFICLVIYFWLSFDAGKVVLGYPGTKGARKSASSFPWSPGIKFTDMFYPDTKTSVTEQNLMFLTRVLVLRLHVYNINSN